jgi:ubiquinone/menaquinone biosynthesis C-methylase UbiE
MGYFLANPLRRLMLKPESLLTPYIREGMTVLEPGPGMGFFTLPVSRMVGPAGKVVAVDIQPKMLQSLRRRAQKAGTSERVETRLSRPDSLGIGDLSGKVDFVLAFAVVHELPSMESFFREAAAALKAGATMLLAEPAGHVNQAKFQDELKAAQDAGLEVASQPAIRSSLAAVLRKG